MTRAPGDARTRNVALAVLAVAFVGTALARGVGETYVVFLLPIETEFGWSRSRLNGVYSAFMLAQGIAAPLAGQVFDRFGPRTCYGGGLAVLGGGYALAAGLDAAWQFYLCVGVLAGVGAALLGVVPAAALVSRWYRARLGTAMGVTYAGLGTGILLIVPATQHLIGALGWRSAYLALGTTVLALLPVLLVLPWRRLAAGGIVVPASDPHRPTPAPRWSVRRAVRDRAFWGLFAVFFFTSVAVYASMIQMVVYLVDVGFRPVEAATAFGFVGLLSTAGMIVSGMVLDRVGVRGNVTLTYGMTFVGIALLAALAAHPSAWLLALAVLVFGVAAGSRGPVISKLAAVLFPGGGLGGIYGTITLGQGTGAATGALLSGVLYDLTGSYAACFAMAMLATLAALAQFRLVPELGRGRRDDATSRR